MRSLGGEPCPFGFVRGLPGIQLPIERTHSESGLAASITGFILVGESGSGAILCLPTSQVATDLSASPHNGLHSPPANGKRSRGVGMGDSIIVRVGSAQLGHDAAAWLADAGIERRFEALAEDEMSAGQLVIYGLAGGTVTQAARVIIAWIRARSASIEVVDPSNGTAISVTANYSAEEMEGVLRSILTDRSAADPADK